MSLLAVVIPTEGCSWKKNHNNVCCFNDIPPYNQLYSTAVSLFSLVNTDIHQYPISFSWNHGLYPHQDILLLLFFFSKSVIFVVRKHPLFWAQTHNLKKQYWWIVVTEVAMVTVTLADDWIHFVLSLATSLTPRGSVMFMIMTLHHIIYRLWHQRVAAFQNTLLFLFGFNFHLYYFFWCNNVLYTGNV